MFGHIEEPWELARHMRVIRELQERSLARTRRPAITEFVPLSFIPYQTLLGRTHGIARSPLPRTSSTRRFSGWRSAHSITNRPGELGEDGLDAATESLSWGVNDLGGTLMEESISRMAGSQHGSRLDPDDLVGGRARGRAPGVQRDTLYRHAACGIPAAARRAGGLAQLNRGTVVR